MSSLTLEHLDNTKLYYLASPYSHKLKKIEKERFEQITLFAGQLIRDYQLLLITPITASYNLAKLTPELKGAWKDWERLDSEHIKRCDALLVVEMGGWRESVGVTAEIKLAKELNLPVYFVDPANGKLRVEYTKHALYPRKKSKGANISERVRTEQRPEVCRRAELLFQRIMSRFHQK